MFNFSDEVTEAWIKNELENIETQDSAHKAYVEIEEMNVYTMNDGIKAPINMKQNEVLIRNPDLIDIQKLFLLKLFRRCVAYRWLSSSLSDAHPTSAKTKFNNISYSDSKSKGSKNFKDDRILSKIAVIERPDPRLPLRLTKEQVVADLLNDASSIKNLIEEIRVHNSSKNIPRMKRSLQDYINSNIY